MLTLKVAVSGANNVGKSCLCNAITGRHIEKEYSCTIGVDLVIKHIDNVSLQLWDLAGMDRFKSIILYYIKNSSVVIFCYSSESYESFIKIMNQYINYKNDGFLEDKHIIIVATMTDSKKAINGFEEWGETFAKNKGFPFIKTSAYTNEGVEELKEACVTILDTLESPLIYIRKPKKINNLCCLI